ncbi:MAG: Phosphoglycerate kinase [Candidatus Levybacteria bacterium]|nr:Phosphoglycerate kinase [Candidatus Levybacteria bacterium]
MLSFNLLKDADVSGKRVFLRADLDVPLAEIRNSKSETRKIEDDTRLKSCLPTIEYLLKQNAKIIIAGHLGRPTGLNYESRIMNQEFSLLPIAKWFYKKLNHNSLFAIHDSRLGELEGWEIGPDIFLLENLRFYPGEEKNDSLFAKKLASLADIYVNEAFANSHRDHASITGVSKYLPGFAGLHLQQEIEVLSGVLENPKRPLVVVIGGAKLETKLPLVEKMHHIADYVLVGGKLAEETKTLLKIQHQKVQGKKSALLIADLNSEGSDITPNSIGNFLQIIDLAKTVIWNGPLGKISDNKVEIAESEKGSIKLAEELVKTSAYTIVGGGDTVGFLEKACLLDSFACMPKNRCFLSTGGGAMLSFLSGEKLPGLEVLKT